MARRQLIINSDEDDFSAGSSIEDEGEEEETRMRIAGGPGDEELMGTNDKTKLTDLRYGDLKPGKMLCSREDI